MEAIDLTHCDDGISITPSKRARLCDDSDVELVEEASSSQGASEETPDERQLGDGEELVVIRQKGQVWNRHLPHIRAQCGIHPFKAEKALQNAQHCDQCYCYICDVAAPSCKAWGTGDHSSDHCNAHPDHSRYRSMREAAQSMASPHTPAQPAGSSRPAQPTRSMGAQLAATHCGSIARQGRLDGSPEQVPSRLNAQREPPRTPASQAARLSAQLPALPDPATAEDAISSENASSSPSSSSVDGSRQPSSASLHSPSAAQTAATNLSGATDETAASASAHASSSASGTDAARSRLSTPAAAASKSPRVTAAGAAAAAPAAQTHIAAPSLGAILSGAADEGVQVTSPTEAASEQPVGAQPGSSADEDSSAHHSTSSDEGTGLMPEIPGPPAQVLPEQARAAPQLPPMQPIAAAMLHPDPRTCQVLRHIGTLKLPFKVKAPFDIPELKRRLIPFGVYCPSHGITQPEQSKALTTRLHINCFSGRQNFMQFLPLPVPYASAMDLPERVFPVTLISDDGREKPVMFGLTIGQDMTEGEIAEAASKHHLAACTSEEETVLFTCPRFKDRDGRAAPRNAVLHYGHTAQGSRNPGDQQNLKGYVLMRIPKAVQPSNMPMRVLIQNIMGGTEPFEAERLAFDVLLPLPEEHQKGGPAAHEAISRQLLHALKPYRKVGMPDEREPHDCVTLLCCDTTGWPLRQEDKNAHFQKRKTMPKDWEEQQIVHMMAQWSPLGLELFHTDAWGTPEIHPSAAAEILAGTRERVKADFYKTRINQEWERKPYDVLSELSNVCAASIPSEKKIIQQAKREWKTPVAQCSLEIHPAAHNEEGTLQVEVYISCQKEVERLGSTSFGTILDSGVKDYASKRHSTTPVFGLEETMEVLLMQSPQAKAMYQELWDWVANASGKKLGVTTLMEMLQARERPAAPQPVGLTVQLHPYQRQALQFMLDSERLDRGHQAHFWAPVQVDGGETFWYSPVLRRLATKVPATSWGGFLAEEMGCGKTVEVLALILSNPARAAIVPGACHNDGTLKTRATLVICPVSLVGQWLDEAKSKLDGSLRLYMYHGKRRIRDAARLATDYDLVVTTYQHAYEGALMEINSLSIVTRADEVLAVQLSGHDGGNWLTHGLYMSLPECVLQTLGADWRAKNSMKVLQSPLNAIRWHRVVLDESHTIKAGGAGQSMACCALKSSRRWCCSGTPISTEIKDFIGQFAFLDVKPLGDKAYFNQIVNPSWQEHARTERSRVCSGTNVLLYTLGRMLMRHSKAQVVGGQAVSQLPPKTEEALAVSFSQQEAEVYLKVHAEAKAVFGRFLRQGSEHINRHLLSIMSLLGPLRRCCSGGALRDRELAMPNFEQGHRRKRVRREEDAGEPPATAGEAAPDEGLLAPDEECSVCLNAFERPTITPCSHWFCRECILAEAEARQKCPLCRAGITAEGLREGVTPGDDEVIGQARQGSGAQGDEEAPGPFAQGHPGAPNQPHILSESKLNVLLKELAAMRERDPAAKALIFTQFSSTLTWLGVRLQQEGYGYRTISGSMALKKRAQAIDAFPRDPPTTVFLLSMRSGAVGINLTAANHVFLMEPAFNPALEDQAVGRAHRMGQTRPVTVKKFYIKGSVEERIMEIITQRKAGQQSGSGQKLKDEALPRYKGRVRAQQDIAGCLKSDRQILRTAELEKLFQDPLF